MTSAPNLAALLDSWELSLKAERKSPNTIHSYTISVRLFLAWAKREELPEVLDKPTAERFIADLLEGGAEDTTAKTRHMGLRQFSRWLAAEGELDADPLVSMKPPSLDQKLIHPLSTDEVKAMIGTCRRRILADWRDEAIIRFMFETTARANEVICQTVPDMKVREGVAVIRRGKGGKGRIVPFGPHTARAIDRYLRIRREHPLAGTDALWLGMRGRTFGYYALWRTLKRRAELAGVEGFHPHRLRHSAADRWLAKGGSESGLMAVAGWTDHSMLMRYTRSRAMARAAEEARGLNLGDLDT